LHIAVDRLTMLDEDLAGVGQLIAGVIADEQAQLERLFGGGNAAADGGGIQAQLAAGGAHAAAAGQRENQRDVVPVKVVA